MAEDFIPLNSREEEEVRKDEIVSLKKKIDEQKGIIKHSEDERETIKTELETVKSTFQEKIQLLIQRLPRFKTLITGIFKEELIE
jgi:DNA gyrase/topoisomerase IV subunit A